MGWTEGQSNTRRYMQLGNAAAVPVFEWAGKRILEALRRHGEKPRLPLPYLEKSDEASSD